MSDDTPKTKENRIRNAGLRMALKLLPPDLLAAAPQHLENYLADQLKKVEPESGEAGACYLISPQPDGSLKVMTVTLDEGATVRRIVGSTTIQEIFASILEGMKGL